MIRSVRDLEGSAIGTAEHSPGIDTDITTATAIGRTSEGVLGPDMHE
jgi:hypothetical protein